MNIKIKAKRDNMLNIPDIINYLVSDPSPVAKKHKVKHNVIKATESIDIIVDSIFGFLEGFWKDFGFLEGVEFLEVTVKTKNFNYKKTKHFIIIDIVNNNA